MSKEIKFIELFAGIGGFRYGLERCMGIESTDEKSKQTKSEIQFGRIRSSLEVERSVLPSDNRRKRSVYTCVWANEWDKYACQTYRKNYGEGELYEGDITKVSTDDIPDHDLITGGFPCQVFSIAGKRRGFDDTRGTLFFEIARICRAKKPKYLLLENVKGLLSHDSGRTFQTILKVLSDIGYVLQWQVLNSKNFGVPQNRERVFIVGHLRGERRPEVFPIGEGIRLDSQTQQKNGKKIQTHRCLEATEYKGYSAERFDGVYQDLKIRRLTPIECERLQGFSDNWTEGISDTQRYKCLGNAVTTNVITAIGEKLLRSKDNE
jgi:DNA (cytosine-5)-methyltransferase 1